MELQFPDRLLGWHPSNTEPLLPIAPPHDAPKPDADWGRYDFIDLGSKIGGSLRHCTNRFKAKGIGIECTPAHVETIREKGFDVVHGDATLLDCEKAVRFVSAMNFLEHLPDLAAVEDMLGRMARAATHFLFIRHPSFEGEETAARRGFRVGHWNGRHHSAHIRLSDFHGIFDRLGLGPRLIQDYGPIAHSAHESIVATSLPMDFKPSELAALPKPVARIDPPWWIRHDIFVRVKPMKGTVMKAKHWADLTRDRAPTTDPRIWNPL